jgi:predicted amidohydrolase
MKICAVQIAPEPGDVARNVTNHVKMIESALRHGAEVIFFPELSLSSYEPKLARELATIADDVRFQPFQTVVDSHSVVISVGFPWATSTGVRIGMVFYQPQLPVVTYAKQLLHNDELPFFEPGEQQVMLPIGNQVLAPAICYESLQHEHANQASVLGATIYLASVAKPTRGVEKAHAHYPNIARKHGMYVFMANCIGPCDDFVGAGQSSVWNREGKLVGQLDDKREGILVFDTSTECLVMDR